MCEHTFLIGGIFYLYKLHSYWIEKVILIILFKKRIQIVQFFSMCRLNIQFSVYCDHILKFHITTDSLKDGNDICFIGSTYCYVLSDHINRVSFYRIFLNGNGDGNLHTYKTYFSHLLTYQGYLNKTKREDC
jgi:hypothetical protein